MASITKRLVVNRPLTNAEVDANFDNLNVEKLERDGSIPMTGELSTAGVKAISSADGLKVYNENGDEIAIFGAGNGSDVTFNGSISVGGGSGSSLDVDGGSITVNNLFVTGRIISTQLAEEYGVSGDGEVFIGEGNIVSSKLNLSLDTVLTLESVVGNFAEGVVVVGQTSGTSGTVTKFTGEYLYVSLNDSSESFEPGEVVKYAGNTATILKAVNANSYKPGHKIKVFGVSDLGAPAVPNPGAVTITKIGTGTGTTYHYWVALFRYEDGAMSAATKISTTVTHTAANNFNAEKNIAFQLTRPSNEYGILLYRATQNNRSSARLVDVLGPAQLGEGTTAAYTDFGGYLKTEWSTKDNSGLYTTSTDMVHFPLNPSSVPRNGWIVGEVESITDNKTLVLNSNYSLNSDNVVSAVHENTSGIQEIISDNLNLGINSINFPAGTYYVSKLQVPSNFVISGDGRSSVVKQVPWNLDDYNSTSAPNQKGSMFVPQTSTPENIYFRNMTVDGNLVNNVKFSEPASNYPINFSNAVNLNFDSMSITNTAGGGVWAFRAERLRLQDCEILNGSLSYSGLDLSPLYALEAKYLTINGNVLENFVTAIDTSVTSIGAITSNTIRNCGSGLLVFGSANLLSSPNLIMGPDNEFIPGPDTLDSDYNAINITVEPGVEYESTNYLYLESGEPVYLGSTNNNDVPGTAVDLNVDIWLLTKLNNVEQLRKEYTLNGGEPRITISSPDGGDFGRENGYFKFKITEANASDMPTLSDLIEDDSNLLVSGEQIMGLVYRTKATTYMFTELGNRISINDTESFETVGSDKFVTIILNNADDFAYFAVGDTVKVFGHASTPSINDEACEVVEKIETGLVKKIKIQLPSAINTAGAVSGGETGYVTIRKTFIIAKGRIN